MKNILLAIVLAVVYAISAKSQDFGLDSSKKESGHRSSIGLALQSYPGSKMTGRLFFRNTFGKKKRLIFEDNLELHYSKANNDYLGYDEIKMMYSYINHPQFKMYSGLSVEIEIEYEGKTNHNRWFDAQIPSVVILGIETHPFDSVPKVGLIGDLEYYDFSDLRIFLGICYRL